MCLILLALDAHPRYSLLLAGNRDEFFGRPTRAAEWWDDAPGVLAGRDLRSGGTWAGVSRDARWAALSNYYEASGKEPDAPSRGGLVGGYLSGDDAPEDYLLRIGSAADYAGFNLLVGDGESAYWLSNRSDSPPKRLSAGVHGLSNHLLDTPWPKVEKGRADLTRLLASPELAPDDLLDILLDRGPAEEIPAADSSAGMERAKRAAFVATPDYGTRSSTSIIISRDGLVVFAERTFRPDGTWTTVRENFRKSR